MNLDWISKFFELNQPLGNIMDETLPLNLSLTGRVDHIRKCSNKMFFLVLRDREKTLQVIFKEDKEKLPDLTRDKIKEYVKTTPESIVKITGQLIKSPVEIKSSTINHLEMVGHTLEILSESDVVPLQVYKPDALLETRLSHRVLDLRSQQNQIIFYLQSQIQKLATDFFLEKQFTWLTFPKLLGGTSESGSEAFHVDYFGKEAFLAQSPQLHKQMAINAGFKKVFSIGPVFRAEKSHTSRHLTEFTGIDFEMEIGGSGPESDPIQLIYELVQRIMRELEKANSDKFKLWETITEKPFNHPVIAERPVVVIYKDAFKMLEEAGVTVESPEDFNNQDLSKLAGLVKEKYHTDLFVLDQFPASVRPFYTKPKEGEEGTSLGYDLIFRGKEILSGAQRISNYQLLMEKVNKAGLSGLESSIADYVDSFKYGSPEHAGGGFGLERIMWAYLDLPNIRNFSLFPRDPNILRP